jgi:IPT/TIG domain
MALQDLNRAADTPIATLKVAEITPKNWHKFPPAIATPIPPAYVPAFTSAGGAPLTAPFTPVEHGSATVIVDDRGVGDYMPRTQSDKATALGTTFADPINTPFGSIGPRDPYPLAGAPAPAAPVISSLSPSTAPVGQPSIIVKVIGTGFTPYSVVEVGGTNYAPTQYVSATELRFPVDTRKSVPGTIDVKVLDHNIKSAASPFVFT